MTRAVDPKLSVSKWTPTTDLMMLRRMGKLQEELSELGCVASRCIIQGIDDVDPGSGKVNRARLEAEIADVYAQLDETASRLGLDAAYIEQRRATKRGYMQEWEAMFVSGTAPEREARADERIGDERNGRKENDLLGGQGGRGPAPRCNCKVAPGLAAFHADDCQMMVPVPPAAPQTPAEPPVRDSGQRPVSGSGESSSPSVDSSVADHNSNGEKK